MQNILTAFSSKQCDKTQLYEDMKRLSLMKRDARTSLQTVISMLQGIVTTLMNRVSFLQNDRTTLLRENHQLQERMQSLEYVLDLKNNLASPQQSLFQIYAEPFQANDPPPFSERVHIPRLNLQKSLQPIPLSPQLQSRRSNHPLREEGPSTPNRHSITLKNELILKCSATEGGLIRAFYLNALTHRQLCDALVRLLNEVKDDTTVTLNDAYSTNHPMVMLLIQFIDDVRRGHIDSEMDLLNKITSHALLDSLLISTLRSRIEYVLRGPTSNNSPTVETLYNALANEFELRLQTIETDSYLQYVFHRCEVEQEQILLSVQDLQSEFKSTAVMPVFMLTQTHDGITFPFRMQKREQSMRQSYVYSENSERGLHRDLSDNNHFSDRGNYIDHFMTRKNHHLCKDQNCDSNCHLTLMRSASHQLNQLK